MKKSCPCIDCICVPVCKHKDYGVLVRECVILSEVLYYENKNKRRYRRRWFSRVVKETQKHLESSKWVVLIDNKGFAHIWNKDNLEWKLTALV